MKSHAILSLLVACGLFACASTEAPQPVPTPPPAPAPAPVAVQSSSQASSVASVAPAAPVVPARPFKEAVAEAAATLLASLPADVRTRNVVIDPLLDGVTAEQNRATQGVEQLVQQYMKSRDKRFSIVPLSVLALQKKPLLLIGTFTGLNADGQTSGARVTYRICLALADTVSGKVLAKGEARATSEGVDLTPLAYFRDAPAWSADKVTEGYIRSCQGARVGDEMDAFYRARLVAGASVNHAVRAYNAGRYQVALDFYSIAMRAGAGDELRIMNGVYLANWKLKRQPAARLVVKRIVGFGIERRRMAVKFLFEPGSARFLKDRDFLTAYPMWMSELSLQTSQASACMNVLGHSSRGKPDNGDAPLSQERAQLVRQMLVHGKPELEARVKALGRGAQDNLIGNGRNDASDLLDRRVVFQVTDCV